jgi:hypothetical protein
VVLGQELEKRGCTDVFGLVSPTFAVEKKETIRGEGMGWFGRDIHWVNPATKVVLPGMVLGSTEAGWSYQ